MTGGQGCADNSTAHCPGQTPDEYRTEFTFWAWTRSVLLFATDPRNLTAIMQETLFNAEVGGAAAAAVEWPAGPARFAPSALVLLHSRFWL